MANKYSKYQIQPYVSMYVDPQKVAVAQILRGRYDENKKQADLLQRTVGGLDVLEGDKQLKQDAIDGVNTAFSDIASTGAYEYAGAAVTQQTTDFIGNEGLKAARQSYANWQDEQKINNQLRAQGKQILFNRVPVVVDGQVQYNEDGTVIMQDAAQAHQSHYQDPTTGEMVTSVYQGNSEAQLDYAAKMQTLVADIATDPVKLKQAGLTQAEVDGYLVSGTHLGPEKIKKIVNGLKQVYMQSDEGIQQVRKLTQLDVNPETGQLYTAEEADSMVEDMMVNLAMKQSGKGNLDYRENKLHWMMLEAAMEDQKNSGVDLVSFRGDVHKNGKNITPFDIFDVDDAGVWTDTHREFVGTGPRGTPVTRKVTTFDGGDYVFNDKNFQQQIQNCGEGNEACREEAIKNMYQQFENTVNQHENFQGLSKAVIKANRDQYVGWLLHKHADVRRQFGNDKEFLQAISTSMNEAQTTAEKWYPGTEAFAAEMNKAIQRGVYNNDGIPWYVRKKGGDYTTDKATAIEMLAKQNGIKASDLHRAMASGSNLSFVGLSPGGAAPGTIIMQINGVTDGKGGEGIGPIQIEVGSHSAMTNTFRDSHAVLDSLRNGNFDEKHDVVHAIDRENGEIVYNHIDYVFDGKAFIPRGTLKKYKLKTDGTRGEQIGGNLAQSQGLDIIEHLFNSNMQALLNSNFQMSKIDADKFSSYQTQ